MLDWVLVNNCCTLPCELKDPGLQSKYLLEKCTNTLSRSCVSPVRENCLRNFLKAMSSVSLSKLKYFKYSSATALLKSLLKQKQFSLKQHIKYNHCFVSSPTLHGLSIIMTISKYTENILLVNYDRVR